MTITPLLPVYNRAEPVFTHGEGAWIVADDGRRFLDCVAGIATKVDLSQFTLPVLLANEQEAAAHEEVLQQLDKASGGKTLWRIGTRDPSAPVA